MPRYFTFSSRLEIRFSMRPARRLLLGIGVLCLFAAAAHGEILDRIIAVVEGHIITLSDVRQERQIRMQLREQIPADEQALAREMVDNYLIDRQSADFAGLDVSPEEVEEELRVFVPQGTPSQAMRDAVTLRIRIAKFFDLRFQQFIRPTDEEIKNYYDGMFVPEAKSRGVNPVPALTDVVDAIRNNLIQEQRNREIDMWLAGIHKRSTIEVFD